MPKKPKPYSVKKLVGDANELLRFHASRVSIASFAAYNALFAVSAFIFVLCFSSMTDVSPKAFNKGWIHAVALVPLFLSGVLGTIGAIQRKTMYLRIYFLSFLVAMLCSMVFTISNFNLECNCRDYQQCSALRDYAAYYGYHFVVPHPVPPGIRKFNSLPVHDPPSPPPKKAFSLLNVGQTTGEKDTGMAPASLSQQTITAVDLEEYQLKAVDEAKPWMVRAGLKRARRELKKVRRRTWTRKSNATFHQTSLDIQKDPPSGANITTAEGFHQLGTSEKAKRHWGKLGPKTRELGAARRAVRTWKRKTNEKLRPVSTLFRTRNSEYLAYHVDAANAVNGTQQVVCKTKIINDSPNLWDITRACRKSYAKLSGGASGGKHLCPWVIDEALLECIVNEACGAVQVKLANTSADMRNWNVKLCTMPRSLYISVDEGHRKEPFTLYFERNWGNQKEEVRKFTKQKNRHLIQAQQDMSPERWLAYMVERRDSTCTCDPYGKSCQVAWDKTKSGNNRFWCNVDKGQEKVCKQSQVKLHESNDDEGRFWTEDLCTQKLSEEDDDRWSTNVKLGVQGSKAKCECKTSLGIRVMGTDKEDLAPWILRDAQRHGNDDVLIGHSSCKKWYSEDKVPWCVVGFDSACSDRTEVTIDNKGQNRVRLWRSSLPCQEEQFVAGTNAGMELCGGFRLMWTFLDWPRLLLLLPYMYMTYLFLVNRCVDIAVQEKGGQQFQVEDEADWSDSSFEDCTSEDEMPKAKAKADPKKKKGSTSDADSD